MAGTIDSIVALKRARGTHRNRKQHRWWASSSGSDSAPEGGFRPRPTRARSSRALTGALTRIPTHPRAIDYRTALDLQLTNTITRIRDADEDVGRATVLSLAMALSLEAEIASSVASNNHVGTSAVSRATWTLSSIKGMGEQARRLFAAAVKAQEGDDGRRTTQEEHEELVERHPTLMLESINEVLFQYQGYGKMQAWSDVHAFSFARVIETGSGSPLHVAILYQAVAEEAGLPLECIVLEDGNYAVLSLGQWAIDPYSSGMLMATEEIAELFDIDDPKPSSVRDVSIALVKMQLYVDWAAITGVFEPAFRLPLEGEEGLDLALGLYDDVSFSYEMSDSGSEGEEEGEVSQFFVVRDDRGQQYLANCVRAAEKLRILERDSSDSRIRLGVLLYFNKRYQDAAEVLEGLVENGATALGDEGVDRAEGGADDDDTLTERILNSKCRTLANKCRLLSSSYSST